MAISITTLICALLLGRGTGHWDILDAALSDSGLTWGKLWHSLVIVVEVLELVALEDVAVPVLVDDVVTVVAVLVVDEVIDVVDVGVVVGVELCTQPWNT